MKLLPVRLVVIALIAGCGGGGGTAAPAVVVPPPPPPPPPPQIATLFGDISVFIPQKENVIEQEPNGTQLQSHYIGDLLPGRTVSVIGHCDGGDLVDGFRAIASERVKLTLTLSFGGTGDPDFSLGLWARRSAGSPARP